MWTEEGMIVIKYYSLDKGRSVEALSHLTSGIARSSHADNGMSYVVSQIKCTQVYPLGSAHMCNVLMNPLEHFEGSALYFMVTFTRNIWNKALYACLSQTHTDDNRYILVKLDFLKCQ
jgi:hypothetical protein